MTGPERAEPPSGGMPTGGDASDRAVPRPYPSVGQSVVLCLVMILLTVMASPLVLLEGWIGIEAALLFVYLTAFGLSFALAHARRKRHDAAASYRWRPPGWRVSLLLAAGSVALLLGVVGPLGSLVPLPASTRESFLELASQTGPFTLLSFVIAAPLLEELLFRGIILDGLLRRLSPWRAILLSAFLFGAVHLNPAQFVTGLVLGTYVGWVYWQTASVGACIVVHMAANLGGYVLRFVVDRETLAAADAGLVDLYGGAPAAAALVIGGLALAAVAVVARLHREFSRLPGPAWTAPAPSVGRGADDSP